MYCPQCGAISTDKSCGNCGAPLPDMQAAPNPAAFSPKKRRVSPLLIGILVLVLVALVDTMVKSGPNMRLAMSAYLGNVVVGTLLWLVLLTSISVWWHSARGGGRRAVLASFIALPIVFVVGYILFVK